MKVKLLKKLRKRFIWYYDDKESGGSPWKVFDKVYDRQIYGLPSAGYYFAERTILMMLNVLGESDLWQSRRDKFEKMRIKKLNDEIKAKFFNHEKLLKN